MLALRPMPRRMALLPPTDTPFGWLPEEFGTMLNRFFNRWPVPELPEWPHLWEMTLEEKEKEVIFRVELPGFEPNELKVELLGERLTIEAEHKEPAEKAEKEEKPEKEATERVHAHVKRVLTLPPGVEAEKAVAVYRNGVLEVTVPRTPEAVGRRIEVKT